MQRKRYNSWRHVCTHWHAHSSLVWSLYLVWSRRKLVSEKVLAACKCIRRLAVSVWETERFCVRDRGKQSKREVSIFQLLTKHSLKTHRRHFRIRRNRCACTCCDGFCSRSWHPGLAVSATLSPSLPDPFLTSHNLRRKFFRGASSSFLPSR